MTSIINRRPNHVAPVQCNFWWQKNGPLDGFTYDGDTFPYPPLHLGDTRYLLETSLLNEALTFYAVETETVKGHPHVVTPPGVIILEYIWDFGDGTKSYGPIVSHRYRVQDPDLAVTLTVIDSRNLRWSAALPITLVGGGHLGGGIAPYKIRAKNQGAGSTKRVRAITDGLTTGDSVASSVHARKSFIATSQGLSISESISKQFKAAHSGNDSSGAVETIIRKAKFPKGTTGQVLTADGATASVTSAPAFTPPGTSDSFKRVEEEPVSNGGKWSPLPGTSTTGAVRGELWGAPLSGSPHVGARWNVQEYTNPVVSVFFGGTVPETTFGIWAALQGAERTGYHLFFTADPVAGHIATIEKVVGGVSTPLAKLGSLEITKEDKVTKVHDSIALTVTDGVIRAWWRDANVEHKWHVFLTAYDSTFTKGYTGIESSTLPWAQNFSAGAGPSPNNNGLLIWGSNSGSKLGGGYFGSGTYFPFPQGVINLTKITQISVGSTTILALNDAGKSYFWGGIDAAGGPLGYNGHPSDDLEDPTLVVGGLPLYPEESLKGEGSEPWIQRKGPKGPVLPKIKEVSTQGGQTYYLVDDGTGRVLSAGGGPRGELGNGWNNVVSPAAKQKSAGEYGQFSPFWVLTGGPAQSETGFNPGGMKLVSGTPGTSGAVWHYDSEDINPDGLGPWGNGARANVLKDVKFVSAAQSTCFFVKTNNEVWFTGEPAAAFDKAVGMSSTFTIGATVTSLTGSPDIALYKGQRIWVKRKTEEQVFFVAADTARGAASVPVEPVAAQFTFAGGGAQLFYENVYCIKDPLWDPTKTSHLPLSWNILSITSSASGYLLVVGPPGEPLLNEARFVGTNLEYRAGNGKLETIGPGREVIAPLTGLGEVAKDVKQASRGEYSIKVLKNDGILYTAGSNFELQQGLGGTTAESIHYLTPITSLNASSRKVVEVASAGEQRGGGRNGGEMTIVRLDDNSVRTWGWGWNAGGGQSINWIGFGTLGTGKTAHSGVPVSPIGLGTASANIKRISTAGSVMMVIQEPGAPPTPTITAFNPPSSGSLIVEWVEPTETPLPLWRPEEGYQIRLLNEGGGPDGSPIDIAEGAASIATFTGLTPGKYELVVDGKSKIEKPAVVNGLGVPEPIKTPSGGKVNVIWEDPIQSEPGWICNWHRVGIFVPKGVKAGKLSAALSKEGPAILEFSVDAFPESVPAVAKIRVKNGANSQVFKLSALVAKGATVFKILSQKPLFDFPIGSEVVEVKFEDWKRTEPEASSATRTLTFDLTPATGEGLAFEEDVEVQIEGSNRGSYKTRKRKKITVT